MNEAFYVSLTMGVGVVITVLSVVALLFFAGAAVLDNEEFGYAGMIGALAASVLWNAPGFFNWIGAFF